MGRGRTPHGVRGLKFMGMHDNVGIELSHPSRGAWIEMPLSPLSPLSPLGMPSRTPHGVRGLK